MDVFDLVAKIRLDSSEYEQGVGKAKGTFSSLASGVKTGLATVAKVGGAAIAAGAAGVAALTKMGIDGYKSYEQLAGGAELLWGNAYSYIADKASQSYKNVQMSQNDYLTQVNGFAVGLKTALGGNEQAAADLADRIITAEADVVAATGRTQEEVQNAFNGIMKNNFTMVDNLGLGITASKEGFQTMIDSVNAYNAAQGKTTKYTIDNVADCQAALVDFIEMQGLSGYASMEAAGTIEGSLAMTKASWSNLVSGLANPDADIGVLVSNMVTSAGLAAQQLLPAISRALSGIGEVITGLSPVIAEALPMLVETVLPDLLTAGVSLITSLVQGVVAALPALYTALLEAVQLILVEVFGVSEEKAGEFAEGINSFFTSIKDGFVALVESAQTEGTLLNQLWEGLQTAFEIVKDVLTTAFEAVSDAFTWCAEQINTEGTWLNETWTSIQDAVQAWFDYVSAAFDAVSSAFSWCVEQINTEGTFLNSVWEGIKEYASMAWDNIKTIISAAIDIITGIFQFFTALLRGDWSAAWDAIKNVLQTVWDAINAIVSNAIEYAKSIISDGLNSAKAIVSNILTAISGFFKTIWDGIKSVVSNVITGVKSAISNGLNAARSTVSSVLTAISGFFKEKWDAIKSTVSDVIDGVKSTISDGLETAKSTVTDVLDAIKKKFTDIFDNCKKIVTDAIDAVKKAFDFEWSLPELKIPHISVNGGEPPYGIGGKGSLPSFDIQWYKKAYDNAMVLGSPTIFGYSNGKFLGGGDGTGNEIVAGESHLMNMIGQVVDSRTGAQNNQIISVLVAILEAITGGNEEMVQAIMSGQKFVVGEREFARLVRTYA